MASDRRKKGECEWCRQQRVVSPVRIGSRTGRGLTKIPLLVNLCDACASRVKPQLER